MLWSFVSLTCGQTPADLQKLSLNQPLERRIGHGETHDFQFEVKAGFYARAEVEQKGIDIILVLFDPDGEIVTGMDSRNGFPWRKMVSAAAGKDSIFRIKIHAFGTSGQTGSYTVKLAESRPAETKDRRRLEAEQHFYNGRKIVLQDTPNYNDAIKEFEAATKLWRELGEKNWEALSTWNLAWLYFYVDRDDDAVKLHNQVLTTFQEQKDRFGEAEALFGAGIVYRWLKKYELAKDSLEKASVIGNELKILRGELNSLNALITVYKELKLSDKLSTNLNRMLELSRELKDIEAEANISKELGELYFNKADALTDKNEQNSYLKKAITELKNAYSLYKSLNTPNMLSNAAICARTIGTINKALNDDNEALKAFRTSLDLIADLKKTCPKPQCDYQVVDVILFTDIASIYLIRGEEEKALQYLTQIDYGNLEYWKNHKEILKYSLDLLDTILVSLGDVQEYDFTIKTYEQIVKNYKFYGYQDDDLMGFYISLGKAYTEAGYYDLAKSSYDKALEMSLNFQQKIKNEAGKKDELLIEQAQSIESTARNNIGIIYLRNGNFEEARKYIQEALDLAQNRQYAVRIVEWKANLAGVYARQKKYDLAIKGFDEVIPQLKSLTSEYAAKFKATREIGFRFEEKNLAMFVGIDLYYYGAILRETGKLQEAVTYHKDSIKILNQYKFRKFEARARIELGLDYLALNKPALAIEEFKAAYLLATASKARDEQAISLDGLMRTWKALNNASLAVAYGKQSVNLLQKTQTELKKLGKSVASEFIKDNENTYRTLADILISEGRFVEAQAVLDLIKEQEYKDISRGSDIASTIPYSTTEAAIVAKIDNLVALEREQTELRQQQKEQGEQFPADKLKRLAQIAADLKAANFEFENALKMLSKTGESIKDQITDIQSEKNLQSALQELGKELSTDVVALYTVIGTEEEKDASGQPIKDRTRSKFGWVILVTPKLRKAYPIDVTNLEQIVFQFKTALSSDKYDPKLLAQKLYNAIFRQTSDKQKVTLEEDLNKLPGKYPDKTLMWSLDGVLRYIPMAALHDGKSYLVEKYRNILFTKESLLWLMKKPNAKPLALGLGVSTGNKDLSMSELPGVERELTDIIRQTNEKTGILSGARKLNDNFKKQEILNLKDEDNAFQLVHIASHYSYNSTDINASYLLTGDGKLTFGEIKTQDNLFGTVDLLTLSACDTGVSGNGKEAEGFAYLAQSLGAKSVIASLWKVSDAGTPELMIRFYKLRSENPNLSKGEAFRRAQLELLGANVPEANPAARAEVVPASGAKIDLPLFIKDEKRPFAHPHFWASFVLIGNWQ